MKKSWEKWYSDEFLQRLKDTAHKEREGDLAYTVKYTPDAVSALGIDPRMLDGLLVTSIKYPSGSTRKAMMRPIFASK